MNPCKYEIPSGSTYGYIIADDAEQVLSIQQNQNLRPEKDSDHLLCRSKRFQITAGQSNGRRKKILRRMKRSKRGDVDSL